MITKTHLTEAKEITNDQATLYATGDDFCRIFHEDMQNLYLLSLLLTTNPEKAEQVFVSGLDDSATGSQVFKEWARSWARRSIIKNAIRLIAPEPVHGNQVSNPAAVQGIRDQMGAEWRAQFAAVLDLQPFERFAFVMSVLEGYSDRECTLLLGCTRESLIAARSRALQQIGGSDSRKALEQPEANTKAEARSSNRNSGFNLDLAGPQAVPA